MKNRGIGTVAIIIIAVVAAGAVGGGYAAVSRNRTDTTPDNGYTGTGSETFSGTWEGEGPDGDYSGEWQFTVDWETGDVSGFFQGDTSGDITGSVSEGAINAEGGAGFGMIEWSGSFNADGSELSGTWEDTTPYNAYSGSWSGAKGDLEDNEQDKQEENDTSITVSSIDATWEGYESGNFEEGIRIRAEGLDTDSSDWRVDIVGKNEVIIYNSSEEAIYFTGADDNAWTKYSGLYAGQLENIWKGYVATSEDWASNYGEGEHEISYGTGTVTFDIDLDVQIDDALFTPPESAQVNEISQ